MDRQENPNKCAYNKMPLIKQIFYNHVVGETYKLHPIIVIVRGLFAYITATIIFWLCIPLMKLIEATADNFQARHGGKKWNTL